MINEHTIVNVGLYFFVLPAYNNASNKMCFYKLAFTKTLPVSVRIYGMFEG